MIEMITSPERFTTWFNSKVPGAYRQITVQDVRLLTELGLIYRYGYYSYLDLETVRAILQYEQMQEKRFAKSPDDNKPEQPTCKICGGQLPIKPNGKAGRPKEYCSKCELLRVAERCRQWRRRRNRNPKQKLA